MAVILGQPTHAYMGQVLWSGYQMQEEHLRTAALG